MSNKAYQLIVDAHYRASFEWTRAWSAYNKGEIDIIEYSKVRESYDKADSALKTAYDQEMKQVMEAERRCNQWKQDNRIRKRLRKQQTDKSNGTMH